MRDDCRSDMVFLSSYEVGSPLPIFTEQGDESSKRCHFLVDNLCIGMLRLDIVQR